MPLIKCSQKDKTLEEFYKEVSIEEPSHHIGESMLTLIGLINKTFVETKIYGSTSLRNLKLHADQNCDSASYVSIISGGPKDNFIEYAIPENKQPWPDTVVRGEADSYEKAIKYLIIAMKESDGWKNSEELKRLYSEITSQEK